MSVLPKMPKLTPKRMREIAERIDRVQKEYEQDEHDRRNLTGKYAPATGKCVVCGDEVRGRVTWPAWDGFIGPSNRSAYIDHWECQGCGLMYGKPPPADAGKDKTP